MRQLLCDSIIQRVAINGFREAEAAISDISGRVVQLCMLNFIISKSDETA